MSFIIRDCQRCGISKVQMRAMSYNQINGIDAEIFVVCNNCNKSSIYEGQPSFDIFYDDYELSQNGYCYIKSLPITIHPQTPHLSEDIPEFIRNIFTQAARCRAYGLYDASGAMFRKTIDVATKLIYETDQRLEEKKPPALRSRIKALGDLKILDTDIVELADIAALDGHDAVHEKDPYTKEEAEALQDLIYDFLDRLFVRPAKTQRIKEKQIKAGVR